MDADISFSLRFPFGSPSVVLRLCGRNESDVREENGRKSWTLRFPFGYASVLKKTFYPDPFPCLACKAEPVRLSLFCRLSL